MGKYKEVYITNKLRSPFVFLSGLFKSDIGDNKFLSINNEYTLQKGKTIKIPRCLIDYARKHSHAVDSLITRGDLLQSDRFDGRPVFAEELCRVSEYTIPADINRENQLRENQERIHPSLHLRGSAAEQTSIELVDIKTEEVTINRDSEIAQKAQGRQKRDQGNYKEANVVEKNQEPRDLSHPRT